MRFIELIVAALLLLDDLQRAISLIPDGQFLLIGRPDRKVERDFKKQGIELVSIGRLTEHELKASILEGQNIDQPDLLLTARVLKRIALKISNKHCCY